MQFLGQNEPPQSQVSSKPWDTFSNMAGYPGKGCLGKGYPTSGSVMTSCRFLPLPRHITFSSCKSKLVSSLYMFLFRNLRICLACSCFAFNSETQQNFCLGSKPCCSPQLPSYKPTNDEAFPSLYSHQPCRIRIYMYQPTLRIDLRG